MKRAFEKKQKTFFLVSKALSFRHTSKKQTSKNVVDTTFKFIVFVQFSVILLQHTIHLLNP